MARLPTLLVPGSLAASAARGDDPAASPVDNITRWLRRQMPEYGASGRAGAAQRVAVVRAETGSGKSTILPAHVFRILRGEGARGPHRGASVLCTQPRVITAVALAGDVAARFGLRLGETVGYQTGPATDSPARGLIYATAGVLAAVLAHTPDPDVMARYRFLIVDEAHERSVEGDLLLAALRAFYRRNDGDPRLPFLLLASATFDPARYRDYFGLPAANVFEVRGRQFEVVPRWPPVGAADYLAAARDAVERISANDDPPARADVLVFLPGAAEIAALAAELRALSARLPRPLLVLALSRDVVASQAGDYPLVFAKALPLVDGRPPSRRVVLSTVVAETGLTIDTLKYVVDCGWNRSREVYYPHGAAGLVTRPAPQSRVHQRRGRVGRLFPGEWHPLYTKHVYESLEAQQLPDILTQGLDECYLRLALLADAPEKAGGAAGDFADEIASDAADEIASDAADEIASDAADEIASDAADKIATDARDFSAYAGGADADRAPAASVAGLLDPPAGEALLAAGATAAALGFCSAPLRLTPFGRLAAAITRAPMEGARVLLAAPAWGAAVADLATAVAAFGQSPGFLFALRAPKSDSIQWGMQGVHATRESLPKFFTEGGGPALDDIPPTATEAHYYRFRLGVADDYAETVLLFAAFARRVDESRCDLAAVRAWCERAELDFEALVALARRREALLEELALAGVDPFLNHERQLAALPPAEFAAALLAFKRCLYDGLRCRLLTLDEKTGTYTSPTGLAVRVPPLLPKRARSRLQAVSEAPDPEDLRPRWVVTDTYALVPAPPLLAYSVQAGLVSVLDGFVGPDPAAVASRVPVPG